jgi:uncharacterized protein YjbJ (UPF0337 family)
MGIDDKVKHSTEDAKGKVKEKAGQASNDRDLENEGKADQAGASLKKAGDKVTDAAGNVKDAFKK